MSEQVHWRKLHNPEFFGEYMLPLQGEGDMVVTILNVERKIITNAEGKKEEATVATLKDQKPWILNVINQKTISKALGSSVVADWDGKSVTVYRKKVKAFGEWVDAVRVRDTAPKKQLEELSPTSPKWQTAIDLIKQKTQTIDTLRQHYTISDENAKLLTDATR